MKRIISIVIVCILAMFIITACNIKKDGQEVKTGDQISTTDVENEKASIDDDTNNDSAATNDAEFELIYNPPAGEVLKTLVRLFLRQMPEIQLKQIMTCLLWILTVQTKCS